MPVFKKARKPSLFGNGKWDLGSRDPDASLKKSINQRLFLNGSWEMLPGQVTPAAGGSHARFLYERWELGNGKWEMAHRPVTMDHRKV